MKKSTVMTVCLLGAAGLYWFAHAGDMEPPGPPAPSMVTLNQLFEKLGGPGTAGAAVAKTGQTVCWQAESPYDPIDCAGTGQDGELRSGISVDPRFTDNGDGTVKDNLTGLIWLQDANCYGKRLWGDALSDASTLADGSCGLTDGSAAGDWRLPNIKELQSLVDFSQYDPAFPPGHPFSGVQSYDYWSSDTNVNEPIYAWSVYFIRGSVSYYYKTSGAGYYVWPVRGGQ